MKVLGRDKLIKFTAKQALSRSALDSWFHEVNSDECQWLTSHDIKNRFSSASFLDNNRVIFNIKGHRFRLVVKVRYQNGIVAIEWVGTHAEYDKKTF